MDSPLILVIAVPLAVALLNLFLPVLVRKATTVLGIILGGVLVWGFFNAPHRLSPSSARPPSLSTSWASSSWPSSMS